jgi:predicted ester cyclase
VTELTDLPVDPADDLAVPLLQAACDATWNAHDPVALAANAAPDAEMRVVPLGQVARGPAAIQALAEDRLRSFPDWHLEVIDAFVAGDRICGQLRLTGSLLGELLGHAPTGRSMDVPVCCVFRLRDGTLIEEVIYFDRADMFDQLGLPLA